MVGDLEQTGVGSNAGCCLLHAMCCGLEMVAFGHSGGSPVLFIADNGLVLFFMIMSVLRGQNWQQGWSHSWFRCSMLPRLYGSTWMLVRGVSFSVSLAVVGLICCSSVPRHFYTVTNTGCVWKIVSIFTSIVLCGGLEGVFLPVLGDWYVGDSFVATLWLILITTGNDVAQRFGEYGNAG